MKKIILFILFISAFVVAKAGIVDLGNGVSSGAGGGGSGDITSVIAGTNLTGGCTTGDCTVGLDTTLPLTITSTITATAFQSSPPAAGVNGLVVSSAAAIDFKVGGSTIAMTASTRTYLGSFYSLTSDTQTSVSATLSSASLTEMILPLVANSTYSFHANIIFQTAATTTGLALAYDCPSDSTTTATVRIHNAADGTAGEFQGSITKANDQVTSTAVEAASTNSMATMDGWIVTSSAGTWSLEFTTEVNGSVAKLKAGTHVIFTKITN